MKLPSRRQALFAVAAVVGVLATLEIAAIVARRAAPSWLGIQRLPVGVHVDHAMVTDPELLWALPPGTYTEDGTTYRINALGMRGPELAEPKPAHVRRVMALGDSSVYGHGVAQEQAFVYLAAERIGAAQGKTIEVANAAVPGYSSTQARLAFARYADRVQPDVVIVASLWSDTVPVRHDDAELFARFGGRPVATENLRGVLRHSAAFQFLEAVIQRRKPFPEERIVSWMTVDNEDHSSQTYRVPVAQHAKNLAAITRAARQRGADVILLALQQRPRVGKPPDPRLPPYRKNFHDVAARFSAPLIDMATLWSDKSDDELTALFLDDVHPNAAGHALIAGYVATSLGEILNRQ